MKNDRYLLIYFKERQKLVSQQQLKTTSKFICTEMSSMKIDEFVVQ